MRQTIWKFIVLSSISTFCLNAHAEWQCFVADQGGHYWTSTGSTQDRANAVATSFCSSYSPDGGSCHTSKCFEK